LAIVGKMKKKRSSNKTKKGTCGIFVKLAQVLPQVPSVMITSLLQREHERERGWLFG